MISRRRAAWLAASTLAVAAVAQAGPGITGLGPVRAAGFRRLAGQGDPGHVALTFDDGPDPLSSPRFLSTLAEHSVRATFFMLGSMVARAPGLAADIAAAGHEVAVHGYDHRYLPCRSPRATRDDLTRATDLITSVTGRRPRFFRPPYGVLSGPSLLAARTLGLRPVLWGAWAKEWAPGATGETALRTLLRGIDGGVTVLLHDSGCASPPAAWQAGLAALPSLLSECDRRGLQVGPVGEHGLAGEHGIASAPGGQGPMAPG